jgi:cyanamide hydratase
MEIQANTNVLEGTALVKKHFPGWKYDDEAYYLSCLFHDIGTADKYLSTTKMSFEFKGAIVAREFILQHGGEEDLADAICEVGDFLFYFL